MALWTIRRTKDLTPSFFGCTSAGEAGVFGTIGSIVLD